MDAKHGWEGEIEPFQMSEEAQKIKWTEKIKNEKFYTSKGKQH